MSSLSAAPTKPLLRGVSHLVATGVSAIAAIGLVASAGPGRALVGAAVYGASLTTLFAVSASYHRPTWGQRARAWMRRLDHSAIFLLIAGTYTPFCLLLPSESGRPLLWSVWAGAVLGILQSVLWVKAPKVLVAVLCLALGWVAIPLLPQLRLAVGNSGLWLLGAGGVAYSVGALVYALKRPDPFPRVFGYHEVFHALVVVAAICHFIAVARVLPALR